MANQLYPLGKQALNDGDIDWIVDDIRCVVMSSTYVYSASHQFHSDLSGILSTSSNFSSKTSSLGVVDAADFTFTSVTGTPASLAIYKWTGVSATSRLIAYMDAGNGFGQALSAAPLHVTWSDGANKIYAL